MISIIVPLYNVQNYIVKCVESIITQSYKDIEIIIIDDGSTDCSLKLVNNLKEKDHRIKVISQKNSGMSSARNRGIELAKGDLLMFVDADDQLENFAIEKLYHNIKETNADIVIGAVSIIYEAHEELKVSDDWYYALRYKNTLSLSDELIDDIHCSVWAKLFKRSIIEKNNLRFPEGLAYEDAYWHWTYLTSCTKISFIEDKVYKYFRHKKSIMSSTFECKEFLAIQHLFVVEKIFEFWQQNNVLFFRFSTTLRLLEQYFWLAFRYSPNYEKIEAVYECSRIVKKFSLPYKENKIINLLYNFELNFLYETENERDNYIKYLKMKEKIDKLLPQKKRLRYLILTMLRKIIDNF